MTTPDDSVTTKDLLAALRSTWRMSREHKAEQANRFLRIFGAVLVPQLVAVGVDHLTRTIVLSLVAPALEVAFRQLYPALGAYGAASAPGVEIVPEQLDNPDIT